jgi:lipoprotein-releasing system permease protein
MEQAKQHPEVIGAAPFVNGQGMLAYSTVYRGVRIRGVEPAKENSVSDVGRSMRIGEITSLRPGEYGIVLGLELARALHINKGEKLQLVTPASSVTPAGMVPRLRSFTVVGIFSSGHYEYDLNLALINLHDAQVLYRMDDAVSGVTLKVKDIDRAPFVARDLARSLRVDGYVSDWTQENATYFRAVQIEKRMMFIILTLIIAVAAFNLVSTLVMVVTDKHPDIAILRTLGASPLTIMKIFIVQGAIVGCIGTLVGVLGGVLLALNIDTVVPAIENFFGFHILSREVYYISELPSDLHWNDVWSIAGMALAMAFVATIYPSWRASRVNPAEALRYE